MFTTQREIQTLRHMLIGDRTEDEVAAIRHVITDLEHYSKLKANCVRVALGDPCEKHSGDNTPPFDEFFRMTHGYCLLCLIEENQNLKQIVGGAA